MTVPLSILDLAHVNEGMTVRDSLDASVALARTAEASGYRRVWYAEHHNMATIASSATSVLIAHIAAHTERIRLGSGGVMLPNHSPLTIAEQFGTLETLHPGRIDLGLGRAPGSDRNTMRALRRDVTSADAFPNDVVELQGYLTGHSKIIGVDAIPGKDTNVPLYILGSSLFGAQLAAKLGLPYSFASHFAPAALEQAVAVYRAEFQPSEWLSEPYVIAGVNVAVAKTSAEAQEQLHVARRRMAAQLLGRGRTLTPEEAEAALESPAGQHVAQMAVYTGAGAPEEVVEYLDWFAGHSRADELIVVHQTGTLEARLRSVELLAEAAGLPQ
ncbi:LLM class flavin-dependent oxidoreductase [Spiractinospora alimapuensis]|uniref:LLM class flavin-dependent oxidoreductase n=1 Tax=Spiractinospora alimapuensis TaxID=2820884 RepID=UPI0022AAD920|nr:LLM class flavin-dependent oxidoreductase [Spiractinospora alimapuensis]QVQ50709.1 LLM class flavin-dependent oxidoreductase [Spiractinospora alimapuensis]